MKITEKRLFLYCKSSTNPLGEIINVKDCGKGKCGLLKEAKFPKSIRSLFKTHEQYVNNQIFSSLDEIEEQINDFQFRVNENLVSVIQIMDVNKVYFIYKS